MNQINQGHCRKDYLRKIDDIGKHLNLFTLQFKNYEFESEWRLKEIGSKKWFYLIILFFAFLQDFLYTFIFNNPPLFSSLIRLVLNIINFAAIYQIFYHSSSKKVQELMDQQQMIDSNPWETIKLRDFINDESKRQFRWFVFFWLNESIH